MINPISWADIFVFAVFLLPNLVLQLTAKELILLLFVAVPYGTIFSASPFSKSLLVVFILPLQLIYDRFTTAGDWTLFQNLVLRVVRFAFGNLNATVGRVFFSESQAFPFARFRTRGKAQTWRKEVYHSKGEMSNKW